jgi:hypothetical protein
MSPIIKNVALALTLALIGWIGYLIFIKDDTALISQDPELNAAILDGQQFLMRIQELDQVKLDGKVLADPRFQSLIDLSVEPEPEETGRENPFGPIVPIESE